MRFVGREHELSILKKSWNQAKQGSIQTVVFVGESRLGKTRIIQEFYAWLNREQDPENYWPDTLPSDNDSLHVNPVYDDQHPFSEHCSIPWLWWGIRWTKPDQRNTGQVSRCAVLADATRLDPHLERMRCYLARKEAQENAVKGVLKTIGSITTGGFIDPVISIWERIEDWQKIRRSQSPEVSLRQQMEQRQDNQLSELQSLLIGLTSPNTCFAHGLPLILVLDDVHWADIESLQFVQRLMRHYCTVAASHPKYPPAVLLIATTWEKEWLECSEKPLSTTADSDPQNFSEVVRTIEERGDNEQKQELFYSECHLQRLREPMEALVADEFSGLRTEQIQLIVERAGGSPGLLTELLIKLHRSPFLFEKGDFTQPLTKTGEAKIHTLSVQYHDLVEERLSEIPDQEAMVLRIASYFGMNYSRPFAQQLASATLKVLQDNLSDEELQKILARIDRPLAIVQPVSQQIDEFRLPIYQEILHQQLADYEELWESILQVTSSILCAWIDAETLSSMPADEKKFFLNFANRELSAQLTKEGNITLQLALMKVLTAQLSDLEAAGRVVPIRPLFQQWLDLFEKCESSFLLALPIDELRTLLQCAQLLNCHAEVQTIARACVEVAEQHLVSEATSRLSIIGLRFLGDSYAARDDIAQAYIQYNRCVQEAQRNIEVYGDTEARLWDLWVAQVLVGDIYLQQDKVAEAQEQYESSLALSKRIIQEYGESAARLRELGLAQPRVGNIYLQQDKVSEAQEQYESSLALSKRIIQEYGESADRLWDLGVAQTRVGDIYLQQDKVSEAQEQYESSLALSKRIIQEYGESADRLRGLGVVQARVGNIYLQQDKVSEAQEQYESSLALSKRIIQEYGESAERLQDLGLAQTRVGNIYLQQDKVSEAQEQHESSLALWKQIIQEYGESAARLWDLGVAQTLVGDIYLQQDQVAEAQEQYESSLALWKRIIQEYGESAARLRSLGVVQARVGNIYLQQDQVSEAQEQYESSLVLWKQIIQEYGESAARLWDLGVAQTLVGDIYLQQDQVSEAQEQYESSLALSKRIIPEYGESAERLQDLEFYQTQVGRCLSAAGQGVRGAGAV